jgi:hypothetical protein
MASQDLGLATQNLVLVTQDLDLATQDLDLSGNQFGLSTSFKDQTPNLLKKAESSSHSTHGPQVAL